MRRISETMRAAVEGGGHLVGERGFHLRVTVEPGWWLYTSSAADAERSDVIKRAAAAWRSDHLAGLGIGHLQDFTGGGHHARLGDTLAADNADPLLLLRQGNATTVYVPGSPGNYLAAHANANRFFAAEAAVPFAGLAALGDALVAYDPAGDPTFEPPDTIEDAFGDPDDFDPDAGDDDDAGDDPGGDGATVSVVAGAVEGGRGVAGSLDAAGRAAVLPGETYTATVSVRFPSGVGHVIALDAYPAGADAGTAAATVARVGSGDWELITVTATMPPGASTAAISVRVTDGTATTFNVRRLQIEPGPTATPWALPATTRIEGPGIHLAGAEVISSTRVRVGGQIWTLHRGPAGRVTTIIDRNLFLFATNDYLEVSNAAPLNFGTGPHTAVVAFRSHTWPAADQVLAEKLAADGARGWRLALTPQRRIRYSVIDGGSRTDVDSDPIAPGAAVVVAGRRSATTASVFVGGVNQGIVALAGTPNVNTTAPLRIGASLNGTGYADMEFVGAAVFADDLSSAELARLRDYFFGPRALPPADTSKMPYRWWQRLDNSQEEIEIPGVTAVNYDRALDTDADTCSITIANQVNDPPGQDLVEGIFGDPGYYTPDRANVESTARWGMTPNDWYGVLDVNACIRIYWGYGGHDKPLRQAVADGDLLLKGVWLVDDVSPGPADASLSVSCRDMFKLCVDQEIYPGFVPAHQYPLERCRWTWLTSSSPYDPTYGWPNPTHKASEGWWKRVADFTMAGSPEHPHGTGRGYWILGNDGKVFAFGWANHYGDKAAGGLFSPAWSIASTPTAQGYWILTAKGHIFTFGDAVHHGDLNAKRDNSPTKIQWRRIRPTKSGKGYYLLERGGRVATFGDAVDRGDVRRILGEPVPWTHDYHTDLALTPTGRGYWILNKRGRVYAFGDAVGLVPNEQRFTTNGIRWSSFLAVDLGDRYNADSRYGEWCRAMTAHPTEAGCWVLTTDAKMHAFGAARLREPQEEVVRTDPVMALAPSQTGLGYMHLTANGDIDPYGDAAFYGSLVRTRQKLERIENTTPQGYKDFTEIVRDLLLWSGFYLHGTPGEVYGNLEATGTYNDDCFHAPFFDKRSVIDLITEIRQIVGYFAWCDEEGAAHFESPNFWVYGNFYPDGGRTTDIPVLDETSNLFEWSPSHKGDYLRSELIIASAEPTANLEGTIVSRFTPPYAEKLKGIARPASWHNGLLTNPAEQELMAELVAMQWAFKQHAGSVGAVPHPAIEINDQVWVYERSTGEARVHYVRGITFSYDARGGATMTLTTNRLGSPGNWLVDTEGWANLPRTQALTISRDPTNPETTGVKL